MPPCRYELYRQPRFSHVLGALVKIAKSFQFLDWGYANYLQVAVPPSDMIRQELEKIRQSLHTRQSPTVTYVGELGEFCERVQDITPGAADEPFNASDTGDELFAYLQDALEVPY